MAKTAEQIAQWVIDSRYKAKFAFNNTSDEDMYRQLVHDINQFQNPPKWVRADLVERVGKADTPIKTDFGFDIGWYDEERKKWFTAHDGEYTNYEVEYLDETPGNVSPQAAEGFTHKQMETGTFTAFVAGYANPQLKSGDLLVFHKEWFERNYPALLSPVVKEEGTIQISVDYPDHIHVVLTNKNGDTYTSKSKELMNFLHVIK